MKKLLAICLSVLLICAAMPFAFATASEEPTIVVSEAEGKAGDVVSVTVSMKNNPGITSTKVKVHYDTNALEMLAKPDGYAMGDFSASGYSWGDTTKSPFVINWCDMINPNNTAELLATLNFKIKDDAAAGTYPLTVEYDNEGDIFNSDWDTVIFGSQDGAITVVGDEPTYEIPETPEGALYFAHFQTGDLTGWQSGCSLEVVPENDGLAMKWDASGADWANMYNYTTNVSKNADYILVMDVKADRNTNMNLKVLKGDWSADAFKTTFNVTTEWQNVTVPFSTNDGSFLLLSSNTPKASGATYYLDNITVFKAPETPVEPDPEVPVEGNLIVNGTFEDGNAGGWKTYQGSDVSKDAAKNGVYGFNAIGNGGWGGMFNQTVAVEAGKTYTLSFWIKVVSNGVNIQVRDDSGNIKYDGAGAGWYDGNKYAEWTYIENTFVAAADTLNFNVCGAGNGKAESAYFDSITLVKEKDPSFDGYISNGDFEMGNLAGWINLWDSCGVKFVEGKDGGLALDFTAGSWAQVRQNGIKVEPNTDYILTGWVKNANNVGLIVKAGDDSGDIKSAGPVTCDDWQQVTVEFNSGDQTSICVLIIGWDGGGSAIVDNVSLALAPVTPPEVKDPTIVVSDATGKPGDTITITVSMKNNPGITSTKVGVGYDASALELLEYVAGDFSASGYSWSQITKNPFVINWCDMVNPNNTAELLATLTFKIKGGAANGEYALTLTYDNEGDIFNSDWDTVIFGADEGVIVVDGACAHEYDGACDPDCNLCGATRDVHTKLVHFDAVEAGCHYVGNIEYWFCPDCECFWADEALTQLTNSKNVIVPAKGGDVAHIEAVQPGCHYIGNIEYWFCAECEQYWQDEALTQLTNSKNVILPATGSDKLQHVEAKDPTCLEAGNIEYWFCPECEQYWQDAALTQLTNSKNVKIAPVDHNIVHMDAVEAGCHYIGNIEYWFCSVCGSHWADEALTQVTNSKNVIIPAKGGDVAHIEAVAPGCHYIGNIEYWYCAECEQFWQDEALTQITNSKNVILPATGSDKLQHVEAKDPTCLEAGNIEYWFCAECEQYWQDAALTQLTNSKNVVIAPVAHNIAHIDAVAPGCHYNGNVEYWYCSVCGSYWTDEALTQITNSKSVILPATGSENLKHVEAKAPTATENGNIEYWFCPDCEQYWQDEALTQLTNSKNVIIPATGETPDSPVTGDSVIPVVVALLTLIASGVAVTVLKKRA